MGSTLFRDRFAALLRQQRMTGPQLAAATSYSRGYVWEVLTGRKSAAKDFAAACDRALHAGGALIAALAAPEPDGGHLHRRRLLVDLGVLGLAGSLAATEAVRHGLATAMGGEADVDEWDEIADEYAFSYCTTPPARLLPDLTAHLDALRRLVPQTSGSTALGLSRAGSQLAVVMAMALTSSGEARRARRWWRTASQAADRSGDRKAQALVRGWEIVNGLYESRPIPEILSRAAESIPVVGDGVCAGTAQLYAGLAQTLAVAGRREESLRALRRAAELTDRMPADVASDDRSLLGWPEVRLRHTESYVHTWLGNAGPAYAAQERCLRLYHAGLPPRQRTQVMLHRVGCMIRGGDVAGGLAYAAQLIDDLPTEHHTDHVYAVGRAALALLPERERGRREAVELRARLASPTAR